MFRSILNKPYSLYFLIICYVHLIFERILQDDDTQGSDNEVCDGTESSVAGEEISGVEEEFSEVCDGTESSMAGEDEPFVLEDLTETEENNDDTYVEETQDLDYFGHSLYGNTGASTIVKETQKKYPNNIDDGCHGNFANNTLIETDRQLDKVEDDDDYDVVIVAAESTNQNDTVSSRTKTRQNVSQARAHSTSGAGSPGGTTSGGRTYRRGNRISRLSRNRPSNNKNARLQNAASDSKQASVLDFFQPLWGKAKKAVETLTNAFSPPEDSSVSTKQRPASSCDVDGSDTGGATTTCDESSDVEGATSTYTSMNSTVSGKTIVGNKPWPLKSQQTSKAGTTIIEFIFTVF